MVARLHRLVRNGYRPWLGYPVASGQDGDIHLRRKDGVATLYSDGTVALSAPARRWDTDARPGPATRTIAGDDTAGFDAAFPPDTPNRRNLLRRLYEIGV